MIAAALAALALAASPASLPTEDDLFPTKYPVAFAKWRHSVPATGAYGARLAWARTFNGQTDPMRVIYVRGERMISAEFFLPHEADSHMVNVLFRPDQSVIYGIIHDEGTRKEQADILVPVGTPPPAIGECLRRLNESGLNVTSC